jgi:hypothetical protein
MDNITVEQLWYTWSDVGLSTVHAGFRIRAASPGLTEIYSERLKSMERCMRYVLPPGTDRFAITPDMAPICLAYLRTDQNEYILEHKKYVGQDGVGRLGNFFIHLLARGEDSDMSFIDNTTSLWGSGLWQTSDCDLQDRRSTRLDAIPLEALDKEASKFIANYAQVDRFLPFIIEAYLTRKDPLTPIYIAVPSGSTRLVVDLIDSLITCLPLPLLADLTFSTYEPDVTKATALIVGTSWIEVPGKPVSPHIFSPQFYQEYLAINCFTGEQSSLHNHSLTINNPLAERFSQYATDRLLSRQMEDLDMLREQAEQDPKLTINHFLSIFNDTIISSGQLSPSQLEYYLSNPNLRIDKLSNKDFRQNVIANALNYPGWWSSRIHPLLLNLREEGQKELVTLTDEHTSNMISPIPQGLGADHLNKSTFPTGRRRRTAKQRVKKITLIEGFTLLAQDSADCIIVTSADNYPNPVTPRDREALNTLLQIIESCILPENLYEVWRSLLNGICANTHAYKFLTSDWQLLRQLLHLGIALLDEPQDTEAISPFLIVSWLHLGEFLTLNLYQRHWEWIVIVIRKLSEDALLTGEEAKSLKQQYSKAINTLLQRLLGEQHLRLITAAFTTRLTEKGYAGNTYKQFQATLLMHLITATDMQPHSWFAAKNMIVALAKAGAINEAPYPALVQQLVFALLSNKQEDMGRDLCQILVSQAYQSKDELVPVLLNSSTRYRHLENAVALIYPTLQERAAFFLLKGAQFLSSPTYTQDMLNLYRELLYYPGKMQRLFILLDAPLSEEYKVRILDAAGLEKPEEYATFLYRYGKMYLQNFQQFPALANYIIYFYEKLPKIEYAEKNKLWFDLFQWAVAYNHQESLLNLAPTLSIEECAAFFKRFGMQKRYISFFRQSSNALEWFSHLVHYEQRHSMDVFPEKMDIVLLWLGPATTQMQTIGLQTIEEVTKIIKAATLSLPEERRFLEFLGITYLPYLQHLPFLKTYVLHYVREFKEDDLERVEAVEFLTYLNNNLPSLGLNQDIARLVSSWQIIHDYFIHPGAYADKLTQLAEAAYFLNLQDSAAFVAKLAKAIIMCVRNPADLQEIMHLFSYMKKIEQLLYDLAEQSAKIYGDNIAALSIYLVFILDFSQNINIRREHLVLVFLDMLLQHIDINAISTWQQLDMYVSSQQLSENALLQWNLYLQHLRLSDKILSRKGSTNESTVTQTQHTSWFKKFVGSALTHLGGSINLGQIVINEDTPHETSQTSEQQRQSILKQDEQITNSEPDLNETEHPTHRRRKVVDFLLGANKPDLPPSQQNRPRQ